MVYNNIIRNLREDNDKKQKEVADYLHIKKPHTRNTNSEKSISQSMSLLNLLITMMCLSIIY